MSSILAAIVSFNPDIKRLYSVVKAIYLQVEETIIYDNGSDNWETIRDSLKEFPKVSFMNSNQNEGIAYALNRACEYGLTKGYDWILTLDQDTICPDNMIKMMEPHTHNDEIGIICPSVDYEGLEKKIDKHNEYVQACMTSASLTRLLLWQEVGGFREDYFIDHVDNEYCLKIRLKGKKILRISDTVIHHELGETRQKKILGLIKYSYSFHSAWRYYYIARNNLCFIREYRGNINYVKEYIKYYYVLIKGFLLSESKPEIYRYIRLGIKDANNMHMGKLQC